MWNDKGNPYRTMGYDGHTGEINNHVVIVTETVEDQTAFVTCLDAKEQKENQEWIAKNIMDELEKKTTASLGVEQVFAGIVSDNVRVNKSAAKIIRQKYPKLFTPGCCTHIFDLLIEDVAKLPEVNEIIKGCIAIAVFVKGHTRVKAAYQRIISGSNGGTMLKTFPDTRFSYADLMLQQVVNNRKNLSNLMDEEQYASNTVADINVKKREEFEGYVGNFSFMEKVETLRGITGPLCKAIHLKSAKCRASWVYPMFIAVLKDYDVWKQKYATKRCFGEETIKKVGEVIMGRWLGVYEAGSTIVPIKDNTWLMVYLMDPYYMPDDLDGDQKYDALLGIEWLDVANEVLKDFYQDDIEAHRAELEFFEAIKKQGRWGKHVQKIKNSLKLPEGKQYDFEVEKVITKQKLMRSTRYAWDLVGSKQFPRLKDIGIRLSVLAVQSANVERVCKVHGVVHTKSRNRLTLPRVIKLIFCYVNLRLLQKEKNKTGGVFRRCIIN